MELESPKIAVSPSAVVTWRPCSGTIGHLGDRRAERRRKARIDLGGCIHGLVVDPVALSGASRSASCGLLATLPARASLPRTTPSRSMVYPTPLCSQVPHASRSVDYDLDPVRPLAFDPRGLHERQVVERLLRGRKVDRDHAFADQRRVRKHRLFARNERSCLRR